MIIRNKIIYGYAIVLGICFAETLIGLMVGNHYQQQALEYRKVASTERKLLGTLQVDILYNRPAKQLSPYLKQPEIFDQEMTALMRRVEQIRLLLVTYNNSGKPTKLEGLQEALKQYEIIVTQFAQKLTKFSNQVQPLTTTPEKNREAEELLVELVKSPEFVAFIEFPDHLEKFYHQAQQQEENAEVELEKAENLRTQIIIVGLSLSIAIAIILAIYTSQTIASPIQTLTEIAKTVTQESNFDRQANIKTKDEVEVLADSFNQLLRRMKELLQEKQEYTEQLEKAKKMADEANQAKSDFLSNISHELRTPLNGILGYAQILERNSNLTPLQTDGLRIIHNSGNHLLTLINDLLDLSKIEARKLDLYPTDIDFHTFLNTVVEMIHTKARQKDIVLVYLPDPNLPKAVQVDEKRLRQILLNLLGNGVKFTDQGKVIFKVQVTPLSLTINQTFRFEIIDTGVGINEEYLETVFKPFEQVGNVQHRSEGTGLGLAISKQLIELMGGELKVESKVNQGSKFWFDIALPVIKTNLKFQSDFLETIKGYRGKKRKILIADDNIDNCLILQYLLEPIGFEVIMAYNGQQEVDLAQQISPDLILTDIIMPLKSGIEAIQEIRKIPELKCIPIIALSASVSKMQQHESLEAGCNEFLPKPVDTRLLLSNLQKYLQLEWIYESIFKPEETLELIAPPVEIINQITDLVNKGRILAIAKVAQQLKHQAPQWAVFADHLNELAEAFDLDAIRKFLSQFYL
ncbi:ATP-binding protein [Crocosphaera chwakensis]|uniref:Circadian input-output histidine kinase CikA n=1 Tax=Crocosphaera chwakensis CCY0110 TaxID=391612 RepID=A3IRJ8_9CHRO|nr:ATP-binding protein [Crocosphaera chwakensis]EAZ90847.1 Multi-sensor Hybrid Histidine Kinase [Crocosphaera chwakensis CCY0110]